MERKNIPYYPRVIVKFRDSQNDVERLRDLILRECKTCKVPRKDLEIFKTEVENLDYDGLKAWAEARFTTQ